MTAVYGSVYEMPTVRALIERPPIDFRFVPRPGVCMWQHITDGELTVIISESVEADGHRWLHVSCSRPRRLPTWSGLRRVKDAFVGKDRRAIQVLPPDSEYVNLHPFVLHLWACMDGDPLPDFRKAGQV